MKEKFSYTNTGLITASLVLFALCTMPKILSETGLDFGFRKCFHTPGLFSRDGLAFLRGFIFELPVAVTRWTVNTGMLPVIALLVILVVVNIIRKRNSKKNEV